MKEKITGKRLSKRRVTEFDTPEELADYFQAEGRPNEDGGHTLGMSFDDEVRGYSEAAKAFLKEQGLPSSCLVFKTASSAKRYVETDEPGAVDFAQWCHKEQGCDGPLPTVGKCLDPAITVTWEEEKPEDERFLGRSFLTYYLMKEKGFAHDALETLAAEIIECCERIQKLEGERALSAAMKLGKTVTLFRHYYRSGKSQKRKAAKPRSDVKPLIAQLALQEGSAKDQWPKLFALMEQKGMSPEECPLTGIYHYTRKNGEDDELTFKTFQNQRSEERKKSR
jgi:hypothetical protein